MSQVSRAALSIADSLFVSNDYTLRLQYLWHANEQSRLTTLNCAWPVTVEAFRSAQTAHVEMIGEQLRTQWYPAVTQLLCEPRDPQTLAFEGHNADTFLRCIEALLTRQLRSIVQESLHELIAFLKSFDPLEEIRAPEEATGRIPAFVSRCVLHGL